MASQLETTTTNESLAPVKESGFISNQAQFKIDVAFTLVLIPTISLFGAITNILNFIVLVKSGVKDCVSICLLSLTISDFGTTAFVFSYCILNIVVLAGWYFYVDPLSVLVWAAWIGDYFIDLTMFHTSFISVERCLCVLFPFHFKNLITFRTALVVLAALWVLTGLCYAPIFSAFGLSETFDPTYNTTRVLVWYGDRWQMNEFVFGMYQRIALNFVNLGIVFFATLGMVVGLKRSSKFTTSKGGPDTAMSKKKLAIVKMVTILALVYIVCTCTRSMVVVPCYFVPGLAPFQRYHNLYQTLVALFFFFSTINSSVNIIVYYKFKPSFKHILLAFLSCRSGVNDDDENDK